MLKLEQIEKTVFWKVHNFSVSIMRFLRQGVCPSAHLQTTWQALVCLKHMAFSFPSLAILGMSVSILHMFPSKIKACLHEFWISCPSSSFPLCNYKFPRQWYITRRPSVFLSYPKKEKPALSSLHIWSNCDFICCGLCLIASWFRWEEAQKRRFLVQALTFPLWWPGIRHLQVQSKIYYARLASLMFVVYHSISCSIWCFKENEIQLPDELNLLQDFSPFSFLWSYIKIVELCVSVCVLLALFNEASKVLLWSISLTLINMLWACCQVSFIVAQHEAIRNILQEAAVVELGCVVSSHLPKRSKYLFDDDCKFLFCVCTGPLKGLCRYC